MIRLRIRILATALLATPLSAQQIVVRDTIEALPPISICQDGATHKTVCTGHRLRPIAGTSLAQYVGQPLEITGQPGAVTCPFVTVTSVTVLPNSQFTRTVATPATLAAEFYGSGAAGDVYLLFASIGRGSSTVPRVAGPVHLNVQFAAFLGLYAPLGPSTPYRTLNFPAVPAIFGFTFYDQAVVIHANGAMETTVVDCFAF